MTALFKISSFVTLHSPMTFVVKDHIMEIVCIHIVSNHGPFGYISDYKQKRIKIISTEVKVSG